jgi:hypothetical protein
LISYHSNSSLDCAINIIDTIPNGNSIINAPIELASAHPHFLLFNAHIPPNTERIPSTRRKIDIRNRIPEKKSTSKSHPFSLNTETEIAILMLKNMQNPIKVNTPEIILITPAIIGIGDFVI